jgi:CBS domain-containing protein
MNLKLRPAALLMTRELVTIAPGDTLRAAAALMDQRHIHCLLVLPLEPNRCLGVITAKDIVQVLCDGEVTLLDGLLVRDAMTSPAFCVQQDFVLGDCIRLMRMSGVRSVPVLDGTRPVGILSYSDVLRAVAESPATKAPLG